MPEEHSEAISVPPDGRPARDQPVWRKDFPLDWPEDEYRSRREFVAFLMLTSAAFVAGQLWDTPDPSLEEGRWSTFGKGDCLGERVGGRAIKAVRIPESREPLHPCPAYRDEFCRLRAKVYSPFLPGFAAPGFGANALSLS
jgi:hypothetical protein